MRVFFLLFQLPEIESQMKAAGETIVTPFVSLDTPGKATVQVVIVADPVSFSLAFSVFLPQDAINFNTCGRRVQTTGLNLLTVITIFGSHHGKCIQMSMNMLSIVEISFVILRIFRLYQVTRPVTHRTHTE